ncbi:hypothetical protein AB0P21_25635 [Kribbella sp. NPDC056861]|uniref:hypothetical protein n=1 Tax=Kribbella sp. NPDC056861 TaxID=3154857 RepID=UPI0034208714
MDDSSRPAAESLVELLDERQHLLEIALWIFDSEATADRIVQETYRRWYALAGGERAAIAVPRAWLTRVAGAVCLEVLASLGTTEWPPDPAPIAHLPHGPDQRHLQVLRSIRTMLRQHDRVVHRFASACAERDLATVEGMLTADITVIADGGGKVRAPITPIHGAAEAARFVTALLADQQSLALTLEPVNGRLGLTLRRAGRACAVICLSTDGSEVTAIWIILNPDKLRRWHRSTGG